MKLRLSRIVLLPVAVLILFFASKPTLEITSASNESASLQNIVINNDFETPVVSSLGVRYSSGQSFDGWTVQSGSIDLMGENYWQNASGAQSVDLNGSYDSAPGTIYQDLVTQVGKTYKLTFSVSGNPDGAPIIKEMKVWWGTSLVDSLTFDITGYTRQNMGWTSHEYIVTAASDITRLKFESLSTTVYGPLIDNVHVILNSNQNYLPFISVPVTIQASTPFLTQIGSAGVTGSGSNNCGPASVAMTIEHFGDTVTVNDAAVAIRGSNTPSNGPTDFKGSSTIQLLSQYGLSTKSVYTFGDIQQELTFGHPIIILVNNTTYRYNSPTPYVNNNDGWFVTNHIIVITGYDTSYVYINDPLRYISTSLLDPANYAMPIAMFKNAASTTPSSNTSNWYAMSVFR